jgi:hypothetical protein
VQGDNNTSREETFLNTGRFLGLVTRKAQDRIERNANYSTKLSVQLHKDSFRPVQRGVHKEKKEKKKKKKIFNQMLVIHIPVRDVKLTLPGG